MIKSLSYILFLFFLPPVYLFSQTEGVIQVDTVVRVDTIVKVVRIDTIIKIDTIIVEKFASDTDEKKDFIKLDFYNDYLPFEKKQRDTTTEKKVGMFYYRAGFGFPFVFLSIGGDFPIVSDINFTPRLIYLLGFDLGGSGHTSSSLIGGLGLGYTANKTKNSLFRLYLYMNLSSPLWKNVSPFFSAGVDLTLFKFISITPEVAYFPENKKTLTRGGVFFMGTISLGINMW